MMRWPEKLSSLTLTLQTLIALTAWFTFGVVLASSDRYFSGFRSMNSQLIKDWLAAPSGNILLLKYWFAGLCLFTLLLGVNLGFCSWQRMLRVLQHRFDTARLLLLFVHLLFGLLALGHFCSFMFGFETDGLRLGENQTWQAPNNRVLKITDITFVDDPRVLLKSKRDILPEEFHYRLNKVEIALFDHEREVFRGKTRLLEPLSHQGMQITLKRFALPRSQAKTIGAKPVAVLNVSSNPVIGAILALYPLMIIGMAIHLVVTWRPVEKKRSNDSDRIIPMARR